MINLPKWIKSDRVIIAWTIVGTIAGALIGLVAAMLVVNAILARADVPDAAWPVPTPRPSAFVAPLPEKRP